MKLNDLLENLRRKIERAEAEEDARKRVQLFLEVQLKADDISRRAYRRRSHIISRGYK